MAGTDTWLIKRTQILWRSSKFFGKCFLIAKAWHIKLKRIWFEKVNFAVCESAYLRWNKMKQATSQGSCHRAYDLHYARNRTKRKLCKVAKDSESKADCSIKWDWNDPASPTSCKRPGRLSCNIATLFSLFLSLSSSVSLIPYSLSITLAVLRQPDKVQIEEHIALAKTDAKWTLTTCTVLSIYFFSYSFPPLCFILHAVPTTLCTYCVHLENNWV